MNLSKLEDLPHVRKRDEHMDYCPLLGWHCFILASRPTLFAIPRCLVEGVSYRHMYDMRANYFNPHWTVLQYRF